MIDEDGIVVDILRTKKAIELMTMDRIAHFLLFGTKQPETTAGGQGGGKSQKR